MVTKEDVGKLFGAGIDCSMVVLGEVADKIGMTKEDAYKVSSCFGGGMTNGTVCGAVTGSYMAIGARYGNCKLGDMDQKNIVLQKKAEFDSRFIERFGSLMCMDLIKLDVRIPEDMERARETGIMMEKCPMLCIGAIEILEDIL